MDDLLANSVENLPTTTCTILAADFSEHAMWLGKYKDGKNAHFFFDEENGSIEYFEDGSAHITGTVLLPERPGDKWKIDVWITDPKNWDQWSSLGRTYKGDESRVGELYKDWLYYTFDNSKSNQLIGTIINSGDTLKLRQYPYDLKYGLQVGYGANDKNNRFGLSVWFTYWLNGKLYDGDFNFDLSCPGISQVTTLAGGEHGEEGSLEIVGLCVDADGNVYATETFKYRIQKITPSGLVTTFAGGTKGSADGIGANAQFEAPSGIAIDKEGNFYVKDAYRIRKITPDGVVSTFTEIPVPWNDQIAIDLENNIYLADTRNHKIHKISAEGVFTTIAGSSKGYADGPAENAKFSEPRGIVLDLDGNIYVSELSNFKIRKIATDGIVTTIAGGSSRGYMDGVGLNAKFDRPVGLAIDTDGNLYVGDDNNRKIRKIFPNGEVITLAGTVFGYLDGPGTIAKFNGPTTMTIDNGGPLYIKDRQRIRKLTQ